MLLDVIHGLACHVDFTDGAVGARLAAGDRREAGFGDGARRVQDEARESKPTAVAAAHRRRATRHRRRRRHQRKRVRINSAVRRTVLHSTSSY